MSRALNYDDSRQPEGYAAGRELTPQSRILWREAFARRAPAKRPLDCLDLGSGTGRFTPLLAELFGGRAVGVEPSDRMRAVAQGSPHPPTVTYLAGRAEQIPLPDAACDLVLMFLSFHHVRDRTAAAAEIGRVLAPGGRVFIRSVFSDRMPDLDWHHFFPRARDIELEMFPTVAAVTGAFAAAGLSPLALDTVRETLAANLTDSARRLRLRSISTFEHLTEPEIEEGFARLDLAVQDDTGAPIEGDSDLMTLGRP